jgi:hypothetical protein
MRHKSVGDESSFGTVEYQEAKLSSIVQSIKEEQPSSMRRKVRLLTTDSEQLVGSINVARLLNEVRQVAEHERWEKHRHNIQQADIYQSLIESLRQRKTPLNSTELALVEIVRRMLELGEVIGLDLIQHIRRALGRRSSQADEVFELLESLVES